jgi:hypothetical protein
MADVVGTCNWRAIDAMGTSKLWILVASTLDSTLAAGPRQLDAIDAVGTSSWRASDAVGNANVVGAVAATSALASSGMSTHFNQFHETLVASFFTIFMMI